MGVLRDINWKQVYKTGKYGILGYSMGAVIILKALPDTLMVNTLRKRRQYPEGSEEIQLDKHIEELSNEVILTMPYDTKELSKIQVFYTTRIDPLHSGFIKGRFGSTIGLPYYVRYRTMEEAQKGEFSKREFFPLNWHTETGIKLANSLVLSDNAKKFLIAQGCQYLDTYELYKKLGLMMMYVSVAFYLGLFGNKAFSLEQRLKPWASKSLAFFYWVGISFLYFRIVDKFNRNLDITVDREAAKMGKDIAKGGIEYYEKTLERNKLLKDLDKKYKYTMYGNKKYSSLRPKPCEPLTSRKELLEEFISKQW